MYNINNYIEYFMVLQQYKHDTNTKTMVLDKRRFSSSDQQRWWLMKGNVGFVAQWYRCLGVDVDTGGVTRSL